MDITFNTKLKVAKTCQVFMKGLILIIALILSIMGLLSLLSLNGNSDQDEKEAKGKNRMVMIGGLSFVILLILIFQ